VQALHGGSSVGQFEPRGVRPWHLALGGRGGQRVERIISPSGAQLLLVSLPRGRGCGSRGRRHGPSRAARGSRSRRSRVATGSRDAGCCARPPVAVRDALQSVSDPPRSRRVARGAKPVPQPAQLDVPPVAPALDHLHLRPRQVREPPLLFEFGPTLPAKLALSLGIWVHHPVLPSDRPPVSDRVRRSDRDCLRVIVSRGMLLLWTGCGVSACQRLRYERAPAATVSAATHGMSNRRQSRPWCTTRPTAASPTRRAFCCVRLGSRATKWSSWSTTRRSRFLPTVPPSRRARWTAAQRPSVSALTASRAIAVAGSG
jgi:hypothetical protein